jgi:hypothetical protein
LFPRRRHRLSFLQFHLFALHSFHYHFSYKQGCYKVQKSHHVGGSVCFANSFSISQNEPSFCTLFFINENKKEVKKEVENEKRAPNGALSWVQPRQTSRGTELKGLHLVLPFVF